MSAGLSAPPLGLYVHLPWCLRKCPYCDFNSHALHGALPVEDYLQALLRDLHAQAPGVAERTIETVFIGGGTPSLFPAEAVGRLLEAVAAAPGLARDAEITLEANPGAAEAQRFRGYRAAGVNRLSVGVQSFDDRALTLLGRIHGSAEAVAAARAAREAGFQRVNLDLMYGLPGQSPAAAAADLEQALALGPDHLSHYQLTLEPGTAFHARPPRLPDPDTCAAMLDACQERLAAAGFNRYEISAYARPGSQCRHNLNYWRFGDYLGIGAGAHGKLTDTAACTIRRSARVALPRAYIATAGQPAAEAAGRLLSPADRVLEFMMNALRLPAGVPLELFRQRTGLPAAALEPGLSRGRAAGYLVADAERLAPTAHGLDFLNEVLELFLPEAA